MLYTARIGASGAGATALVAIPAYYAHNSLLWRGLFVWIVVGALIVSISIVRFWIGHRHFLMERRIAEHQTVMTS